jgi:hypothetical protein
MLRGFPAVQRWADTRDVLQASLLRLLHALEEVRPSSSRDFFGLAAEQIRRELLDRTFPATRCSRSWVAAAWASFTRPARRASTASSPSR